MNKNRLARPVAVVGGFMLLCASPILTRAQSAPAGPVQAPKVTSSEAQMKPDSVPVDYFAGLSYTEEQKTKIDQIHRDTKALVNTIVKDEKLTADQKDAMLLGYRRMENRRIYEVLTPEQQRKVRQSVQAHRAEKQTGQAQAR